MKTFFCERLDEIEDISDVICYAQCKVGRLTGYLLVPDVVLWESPTKSFKVPSKKEMCGNLQFCVQASMDLSKLDVTT